MGNLSLAAPSSLAVFLIPISTKTVFQDTCKVSTAFALLFFLCYQDLLLKRNLKFTHIMILYRSVISILTTSTLQS